MGDRLYEIGQEIASLWGAECYLVEIDTRKKVVIFSCIEFGERFIVKEPFEAIKTEYGYDVADYLAVNEEWR